MIGEPQVIDLKAWRRDETRYATKVAELAKITAESGVEFLAIPGNSWNGWVQTKDDYNLEDPERFDGGSPFKPVRDVWEPGARVSPVMPYVLHATYSTLGQLHDQLWDHDRIPGVVVERRGDSYLVEHLDGARRSYYANELTPCPSTTTA